MAQEPEIKRHANGSIDTAYDMNIALKMRSESVHHAAKQTVHALTRAKPRESKSIFKKYFPAWELNSVPN